MAIAFTRVFGILSLGACLSWAAMAASGPPPQRVDDPKAVQSRMENLERLVKQSSAARRIDESGDPEARELKAEAAKHLDDAQGLLTSGDAVKASASLQEATDAMFAAIRKAGPGAESEEKKRKDLETRIRSAEVLVTALERIAREKGEQARYAGEVRGIRAKLSQAEREAADGRLDQAKASADGAYASAKATVENLRQGDTLVRSLNFANKEEEYKYELDRNDTHKMLMKVLLEDKPISAATRKAVDQQIAAAAALRARAEKEAAKGDFGKAVSTLEDSTEELVKGIRRAGIYIPG